MKMLKTVMFVVLMLAMPFAVAFVFAGDTDTRKGPIIIDVRTEAEWKDGHLEGAVLIPHEQIGEGITRVTADRKAEIYLYCRSGRRSAIAVNTLKQAGYENLSNLGSMENASKVMNRGIVK